MGTGAGYSGKHDVVYILKSDVSPEELKYSLRSLENFPHGKVWFFTGCPNGLKPDRYVPFKQIGEWKWQMATSTYRAIAETDEVSDDFWMFNDDFFILEKVDGLPYMYHNDLMWLINDIRKRHSVSTYSRQLDRARMELEFKRMGTLNYCLHVPMLFNKEKVLKTMKEFPNSPMFRSLYGNMWNVGGVDVPDVKIYDMESIPQKGQILLSTYDESFKHGKVGEWIRTRFQNKSRWEE